MRRSAQVMGTVSSLDIPGCADDKVFDEAFDRLQEIDYRFSPFKADSEVSLYRSGDLKKPGRELKGIAAASARWEEITKGYFSAYAGGQFDPSGYVKGWAISEAAKIIKKSYETFCLGIGGDIFASGEDKIWNIGIQDPYDRQKVLRVLKVKNAAIATSGNYERGQHIINPHTNRPAGHWASVTVLTKDIIRADVLATAAFAMGEKALKFADEQPDCRFIIVSRSGEVIDIPGKSR